MSTNDERPMDDDTTVGVVPTPDSEEPTGSTDEDEALREVDLLSVVVNAPKRKERAYSADQVDSLLRAAQEHMDLQTERLHELLAAVAAHDGTINALVAQYGDEADSLREQILSLRETESSETAVLSERLGQVTAANSDLREAIESANAALEIANKARAEAESKPVVKPEVSQASELLSRAAALADEHVANAKRSADAIVSQAQSSVSSTTQQAEEIKRVARVNLAEMVAFLERTLEEARKTSI